MKQLGKTQKAVIRYLKKYPDGVNSFKIQTELADNGSHWSKCLLPSLKRLVERGIVKHYFKWEEKWYEDIGIFKDVRITERNIPASFRGEKRISSIWQLEKEE